jgi:hypothetical protein
LLASAPAERLNVWPSAYARDAWRRDKATQYVLRGAIDLSFTTNPGMEAIL